MAHHKNEIKELIIEMRCEVQNYKPGQNSSISDRFDFPNCLYIGLFGHTGSGKTSLINSLKCAVLGRLRRAKWLQVASQEKAGGHTLFRKLANLTNYIYVIDNRGLDNPAQAVAEISAQLDGERGYSEQVEWQAADDDGIPALESSLEDVTIGHEITCAIFVFSARHDIDINIAGLQEITEFVSGHQGTRPLAVITHVDVAERTNVDKLKSALQRFCFRDVFKVANITTENLILKEPYQSCLLSLLKSCLTVGEQTMVFKHNRRLEQARNAAIRRRRREVERQKQEELRRQRMHALKQAREEERREEERRVELRRQRLIQERVSLENYLRMERERHMFEMQEMERQRHAREERDRQWREVQDRRHEQAMRAAQAEIRRQLAHFDQTSRDDECVIL